MLPTTDAPDEMPSGSRTGHGNADGEIEDVLTFTYQEGLTMAQVTAAAGQVQGLPFQTIKVEREESDIESLTKFMAAVKALDDSGAGREFGGIVYMTQVGVVIRGVAGNRMMAPDGTGRRPHIYSPCNDPTMIYAAFANDCVALANEGAD